MSSLLHERKKSSIIMAVSTILLGLALIIFKDVAVKAICTIIGVALIVWGGYYLIGFFVRKKETSFFQLNLFLGIILLLVGIWMAFNPGSVIGLIQYVLGIFIIIHGIIDLQAAFNVKRGGDSSWWISLLLAAITLGMGALILINPFGTLALFLTMVGVVLIFDGISDLFIIFQISSAFKAMQSAAEQAQQEMNAVETEGTVIDDD